jgi:hypothetical protein
MSDGTPTWSAVIILSAVLAVAAAATAAETQPPPAAEAKEAPPAESAAPPMPVVTAPDLCKGAVDPYVPGAERARFFEAAGVDGELTAAEFAANASKAKPFARKFDRWEALVKFDKSGEGTIDWFEAEAYRRDLRRRVLAAYDRNKDRRLTGEERKAANAALAAGRVAAAPTTRPARPGGAWMSRPAGGGEGAAGAEAAGDWRSRLGGRLRQMMERYDTDGDGELSESEREAMRSAFRERMAAARERYMLHRYDANKDGELDEAETAAMEKARAERRARMADARQKFIAEHDTDGDGELSEAERSAMVAKLRARVRARWREMTRPWDADDDGQLSEQERGTMVAQFRRTMEDHRRKMDADGDGEVSREEARAYWQDLRKTYDTDKDGELSAEERRAMIQALRDQMLKAAAPAPAGAPK